MTAVDELKTVRDWLRYAVSALGRGDLYLGQGQETLWDEALALVLGVLAIPQDRAEWVLDGVLLSEERRRLAAAVHSRLQGRPTAYITGRAPYCGLEFFVDERVLIPRSPLGMMLTEGLQPWLGAEEPRRIVDLCTGSGCLGIVAALAFPEAEVVLTDIDPRALRVAQRNVAKFHLEYRIELRAGDGLAALEGEEPFDLVLANPPYVDQAAMEALPKEFRFEPRHALAAGEDGLAFVTPFLKSLSAYLAPEGLLALEVGYSAPALEARYPEVPWLWPDLPQGGAGLALLSGSALRAAEAAGALA